MVQFGREMDRRRRSDWEEHYLHYKELKKILAAVPSPANRPSVAGAAKAVTAAKTISKLSGAAGLLGKMKPPAVTTESDAADVPASPAP